MLACPRNQFFLLDAVEGARRNIPDGAVDLVVTDPPYGIEGHSLHKHYNRNEAFVVDGYVEVPAKRYEAFTKEWVRELERVLRPGGSAFVVSGYTNLRHLLNALAETSLQEVNHLIWKYNFGVATRRKFVSSHYHILYCYKPGGERTFNSFARYGSQDRKESGRSLQYADLEDVWIINREYKPGQVKNKNQLPSALLAKILQYASNPDDLVLDFFLGSFSTAVVAKALGRDSVGFELNPHAFASGSKAWENTERNSMLVHLPSGQDDRPEAAGTPFSTGEVEAISRFVDRLVADGSTKKEAIRRAMEKHRRGYWSIEKVLKKSRGTMSSPTPLFE